jgi:hypothetical protein
VSCQSVIAAASKSAAAASEPRVDLSAAAASKSAAAGSGTRVDRSVNGPVAVAALAGRPSSAALAAIARGLEVSPARLAAALGGVKQAEAGR